MLRLPETIDASGLDRAVSEAAPRFYERAELREAWIPRESLSSD